jgi:hypothetical protein
MTVGFFGTHASRCGVAEALQVALPLAMIVAIATEMLMVAPGRVALRRRLPNRHRRHGVRRM